MLSFSLIRILFFTEKVLIKIIFPVFPDRSIYYLRSMSPAEAKKQIENLSAELKQHSYNYYVLAMPAISDFEFDKLLDELNALEKQFPEFADPDSPTQRVGGF